MENLSVIREPGPCLQVLVVDDVEPSRKLASALFRSLGHSAETSASGPEAFYLAIQVRFDVVLLDLSMPGMDGIEVARMFRLELPKESATRRDVAIFGTTAGPLPDGSDHPPGGGMDAWIPKPITMSALRSALERLGLPKRTGLVA